jgi:hypothetical protein
MKRGQNLAFSSTYGRLDRAYVVHFDGAFLRLARAFASASKSQMAKYPEYDHLHAEVESVLANLAQLVTLLLELFRSKDLSGVHRLDKELELTVGEKEPSLGALRQQIKEHKCETPLQAASFS